MSKVVRDLVWFDEATDFTVDSCVIDAMHTARLEALIGHAPLLADYRLNDEQAATVCELLGVTLGRYAYYVCTSAE